MDAGIADTINRQTARKVARKLDMIDAELGFWDSNPWCNSPLADTFMGTNGATDADRAWLVGVLAAKADVVGLDYRSYPADSDWENLFANLRNEVMSRRDSLAERTAQTHGVNCPAAYGPHDCAKLTGCSARNEAAAKP